MGEWLTIVLTTLVMLLLVILSSCIYHNIKVNDLLEGERTDTFINQRCNALGYTGISFYDGRYFCTDSNESIEILCKANLLTEDEDAFLSSRYMEPCILTK